MKHHALAFAIIGFWTTYRALWEGGHPILAIVFAVAFSFAYDWCFIRTWVERKTLGEIADRLESGVYRLRASLARYLREP